MNYSNDSKPKHNESSSKKKNTKKVKKTKVIAFRVILIAIIIAVFAAVGAGFGIFMGILKGAPDISQLELKPTTDYTSFVYDYNGSEVERLSRGQNRIYADLDQIPKHLQDAVVAVEDERFWEHNGIDIKGILRAVVKNLSTGKFTEGASTITQQLIKNNILTSEKTITRKIQEQYLALQFNAVYEKEIILEYYLNTMHLGNGNNGVQAAANYYFNKDVSELSLRESVVIAGITQFPGRYDPIREPENNHEKSLIILNKMVEQGKITEAEKEEALAEDPYTHIATVHKNIDTSSQSYFVDAVIDQVIKDLQTRAGMTKVQANNTVYGGGVSIYTTLDQQIQSIVDKHMADDSLFPDRVEYSIDYTVSIEKADGTVVHRGAQGIIASKDDEQAFVNNRHNDWGVVEGDKLLNPVITLTPQAQAAFVIMDHQTGHVQALSGGRGEKVGNRTFNRATTAERQPGSTFKVLASYAPALDMGLLSPGSVIMDEKVTFNKGKSYEYTPNNWYSGYRGPVTVREGIYDSLNIIAVKAIDDVGLDNAFQYLQNFGFTTLTNQDKVYALPLGGLTTGVTPLELNAAYAAIANKGTYTEPILYKEVRDRDGNLLLDNSTPETRPVIKSSTASMLTDMMEDTITEGTGSRIGRNFPNMSIAGKTGTTSDNRDFLFAGYTPYYTATVWMGYDTPKSFNNSNNSHLTLWAKIMQEIHQVKELPNKSFDLDTTGYKRASVCGASGKLATSLCRQDSTHGIVTDYFSEENYPTKSCDVHGTVQICKVSGKIATEFCPPSSVVTRVRVKTNSSVSSKDLCNVHTAPPVKEPEPVVPPTPPSEPVPPVVTPPSEPTPPTVTPSEPVPPTVTPSEPVPPVVTPSEPVPPVVTPSEPTPPTVTPSEPVPPTAPVTPPVTEGTTEEDDVIFYIPD